MIDYRTGDATQPIGSKKKLILHICNDIGAWGAGFVLALSARWPEPENAYRSAKDLQLGRVIYAKCEEDIAVANIIGQHLVGVDELGRPPIRYDAVIWALEKIAKDFNPEKVSIHLPRMGCGLAGGNWAIMERILEETLQGFDVTVYDLESQQ